MLGSLFARAQPLMERFASGEAAAAQLQEAAESSDSGADSMRGRLVAEMGRLGAGSLLLRCNTCCRVADHLVLRLYCCSRL